MGVTMGVIIVLGMLSAIFGLTYLLKLILVLGVLSAIFGLLYLLKRVTDVPPEVLAKRLEMDVTAHIACHGKICSALKAAADKRDLQILKGVLKYASAEDANEALLRISLDIPFDFMYHDIVDMMAAKATPTGFDETLIQVMKKRCQRYEDVFLRPLSAHATPVGLGKALACAIAYAKDTCVLAKIVLYIESKNPDYNHAIAHAAELRSIAAVAALSDKATIQGLNWAMETATSHKDTDIISILNQVIRERK